MEKTWRNKEQILYINIRKDEGEMRRRRCLYRMRDKRQYMNLGLQWVGPI